MDPNPSPNPNPNPNPNPKPSPDPKDERLRSLTDATTPFLSLEGMTVPAKVVAVHDGDTARLAIPWGGGHAKIVARVHGIDTPEIEPPLSTPNRSAVVQSARRARDRLVSLLTDVGLQPGTEISASALQRSVDKNRRVIRVALGKNDKYGRTLVSFPDIDVAGTMVAEGLARPYEGGKKPS